jgi:hypothetical protein
MINIDELYIVNYCHPNCIPLKNIVRLPKEEAFLLANEMATKNPKTTAFWRFEDFENYYPLRIKQDARLFELFISLGGKPKVEHPLSFVLQGSEYLNNWFDKGTINKILLKNIPSEYISFTYSDSGAVLNRTGEISIMTKEMLLDSIRNYEGTVDEYMSEIAEKYNYIEVQLWNDDYCTNEA